MARAIDQAPRPHLSPERAALAEAIAAAAAAREAVAAATKAGERAQEQRWAAEERLERLRAAKAEAAVPPRGITNFIASVAAGSPGDADVLERPADTADEAAIEREVAAWQKTEDGCAAELKDREQIEFWAKHKIGEAVRNVVRASGITARLVAEAQQLRAELQRANEALAFIAGHDMAPDAERQAVRIGYRLLEDDYPTRAAWDAAVKALATDPDAPLPE